MLRKKLWMFNVAMCCRIGFIQSKEKSPWEQACPTFPGLTFHLTMNQVLRRCPRKVLSPRATARIQAPFSFSILKTSLEDQGAVSVTTHFCWSCSLFFFRGGGNVYGIFLFQFLLNSTSLLQEVSRQAKEIKSTAQLPAVKKVPESLITRYVTIPRIEDQASSIFTFPR